MLSNRNITSSYDGQDLLSTLHLPELSFNFCKSLYEGNYMGHFTDEETEAQRS